MQQGKGRHERQRDDDGLVDGAAAALGDRSQAVIGEADMSPVVEFPLAAGGSILVQVTTPVSGTRREPDPRSSRGEVRTCGDLIEAELHVACPRAAAANSAELVRM
jgi:hypothetical protein